MIERLEREKRNPHQHTYNSGIAFFYTGGEDCYLIVGCDYMMDDGCMCGRQEMLKGSPLVFG